MRWACKSELSVYTYKIDLDLLLSPIYHLVLDLVKGDNQDEPFYVWAEEAFKINEIYGKNKLDDDVTEESFLIAMSRFLENYLYSQDNCLENKGIKLLYRNKGLLIAPAKSKPNNGLIKWIKQSGMISMFFELVSHASINSIKSTLIELMNEQYFGLSVKVTETGQLKGAFIKKNMVVGYDIEPIDSESLWLCKEWQCKTEVHEDTEFGEVSFTGINGYGITIGDYILPLETIDQFVKPEAASEYFWVMLNNVYALRNKSVSVFREKCKGFSDALKKSEFALLMNKLQYNLYLRKEGQEIPEENKSFFEEVYNIEEFKEKNNQLLFTGNHLAEQIKSKQTMLGLYSTQKEGTEFNLRAWISVDTADKQRITKGEGESFVNIQTVYALKPQYSYYFCKDYFEDMFAEVLKECGAVYLSNIELSKNDNPTNCYIEIDNMVKKHDGTIIYIENKTTMNRYNIEDTLNEVSKFHEIMTNSHPNVRMEYLMVSPYKNETVEKGYSYFTRAEGCSVTDFMIPVARFDGVNLHCVVEPEYDKLIEKMEILLK